MNAKMLKWETNLIIKTNIDDSHLILLLSFIVSTVMLNCCCSCCNGRWHNVFVQMFMKSFHAQGGTQSLFESSIRAHIVSEKCILLEIPFYACTFTQYAYWYQGICKKCKPILNICLETKCI